MHIGHSVKDKPLCQRSRRNVRIKRFDQPITHHEKRLTTASIALSAALLAYTLIIEIRQCILDTLKKIKLYDKGQEAMY